MANNPVQKLYDSLSHADAVLLGQTPAVMMPRYSALPELALGHRRYVVASDGLYVQARTEALRLTIRREAFRKPLPYGELKESVEMTGGLIPGEIYRELCQRAVAAFPLEWAAFVILDQGHYRIAEPAYVISSSVGHISYRLDGIDESKVVLDVHSHGRFEAFFSDTDDESDADGIRFASVFGRCGSVETITSVSRLVIDGEHYPLNWHPWETP